jgi:hypothetical protein
LSDDDFARLRARTEHSNGQAILKELEDFGVWSELFRPDDELSASMIESAGNDRVGRIAILSITEDFQVDWQYLVFRRDPEGWRFLGNIDVGGQRYAQPAIRIQRLGEIGAWLVLRYMAGGGSGVADYSETWYDLSGGWRTRVLRFPREGHFSGWGGPFGYAYSATEPRLGMTGDQFTLEVDVEVSYVSALQEHSSEEVPLFDKTFKIRYSSDPVTKTFAVDSRNSTVPLPDVSHGFTFAVDLDEYYYDQLFELARQGNKAQRAWLKTYVEMCVDEPRKSALLGALNQ